MSDGNSVTPGDLVDVLTRYRYVVGSEADFQAGLGTALDIHGIRHLREYDLGKGYGRIDFFVHDAGIGIELKVKGSPSEVTRQLYRYALCPEIKGLILATGRFRLTNLPRSINGKPILIATLWQGQF